MSKSSEWQTPPWLVHKLRAAMGGTIDVDAATTTGNPVGATSIITAQIDALSQWTDWDCDNKSLFLNPPGSKDGKLVRCFWSRWDVESKRARCASWVGFNLDQLRFVVKGPSDCLIIPRKRVAYVNPQTGLEVKGAQIGSFILLRGKYRGVGDLFPASEFNCA